MLLVTYEKAGARAVDAHGWQYGTGETLGSTTESWVYLQLVRLPPGATIVTVEPPADEIRDDESITLTWRRLSTATAQSAPGQWRVGGDITYRL
jgi:hypothetical protein